MRRLTNVARIFEAWSDEEWVVEGAAVRVALICFSQKDDGDQPRLDGATVAEINADLTSGISLEVGRLADNKGVSFIGDQKNGQFDIPGELARAWIALPQNPNGRPNSERYPNLDEWQQHHTSRRGSLDN